MRRLLPVLLAVFIATPASSGAVTRSNPNVYATGGVSIKLDEPAGSIYRPGEDVRCSFITEQDAYVIIFDIDTDGYVHLLYPQNGALSQKSLAGKKYALPDYDEAGLVVSGPTGIELIFALAVPDRDHISEEELSFLAENEDLPMNKKFKIDGDPLLAANTIASELVRNIGQLDGVSLAYTYFYINDRVTHPRYACAECHRSTDDPYARPCTSYEFDGALEQAENLAYPLQRGFEVTRLDARGGDYDEDEDEGEIEALQEDGPETNMYVAFYPYDSYIHSPRSLYSFYMYDPWYWAPLWADPWWGLDPFYPGYSGFSFYYAWGWDWGSWGWGFGYPYHYRSWWDPYRHYYPRHHNYYYCGDYYNRAYRPHHTRYKSDLFAATARNAGRDPDMLINSVRYKGDRNAPDRYYEAGAARGKTRSMRTDANHRSTSTIKNRDRAGDGSRSFIPRDKTHIFNDRRSKSRSSSSYVPKEKARSDAPAKSRSYRTLDRKSEAPKGGSKTREQYAPDGKRNTPTPSKARSSTQIRRNSPSGSQPKAVQRNGSGSGSGSGKSQAPHQRSNQSSGKKKSRG
ncbi:MAG: DUF4384 domain-containing protein [Chitinivibrionia bacterium]|nr:DUF4384 domain-containing protein [Chitinivibrionia bacterium]